MKSWLDISAARLAANFRAIGQLAGPQAEVLAVIKADAYGHGATLCAPILRAAGARWFGVTDVAEAIAVRQALAGQPANLMVMCGFEPLDFEAAAAVVAYGLTPVVWTAAHLATLEAAAAQVQQPVSIHLEIDTGMARQGVAPGPGLDAVLHPLSASRWLTLGGVMTHLCCAESCAESSAAPTTLRSQTLLADALQQVAAYPALRPAFIHIGNTSALDEGSTMATIRALAAAAGGRVMVRPGLGLYGYCLPIDGPSAAALEPHIQPVLTWKTTVIGLREIAAGATVGYGATFTASHPMRLALLPVGYADGFRREASSGLGNGWVMLRGQRTPVTGRVSMNLTVVDVSGIPGVTLGDPATLLGDGVTADDHARWARTIPYDILCGIRGQRRLV